MNFNDEIIINYGGVIRKAKPASGFDGICNNPECIKVVFEGDRYPKTVYKRDVISINGKKPKWGVAE